MYSQSPLDRVAIFIDGENIHYSAKHLNMRLDYLKLCRLLTGKRRLLRAFFYTAVSTQSEGKIDFINFLKLNGFTVVTREVRSFADPEQSGRSVRSALDMEMAMDVMELCPHLDTVIICSGDGDFCPLVEAAARRGKHVEVCALREMTATDLIAAADVYVDLGTLREEIALDNVPQREIRNEIDTSADGFDDFRVQDTNFDF
ncbi:MAG: NYN domain-containing protein [Candidatus Krumholzibacteria bacterium]|jgi:uncharacterized LabA/DUF88 family protein|nr:NYN domain-containing protein [Candidatus Krumholzibacteria bacterium]MDY0108712.1 NYN domain-containing protein [Candidatus Krumholzibacteria bacterium]